MWQLLKSILKLSTINTFLQHETLGNELVTQIEIFQMFQNTPLCRAVDASWDVPTILVITKCRSKNDNN